MSHLRIGVIGAGHMGRLHAEKIAALRDEGVGVGLAIVRAAVEAHGGFVRAAARPGGGTEVRFSLDAAPIRAA